MRQKWTHPMRGWDLFFQGDKNTGEITLFFLWKGHWPRRNHEWKSICWFYKEKRISLGQENNSGDRRWERYRLAFLQDPAWGRLWCPDFFKCSRWDFDDKKRKNRVVSREVKIETENFPTAVAYQIGKKIEKRSITSRWIDRCELSVQHN